MENIGINNTVKKVTIGCGSQVMDQHSMEKTSRNTNIDS